MTPVFQDEVMLAGWSESHNGGAKVTFWLSDPSMLSAFRSMTVAKGKTAGQRLACVLVEIGDDEKPIEAAPLQSAEKAKGDALAKLAGQWCQMPEFADWLSCNFSITDWPGTPDDCADVIRDVCGVDSRVELDHDASAAALFHREIRLPFQSHLQGRQP